VLPRRRLILAQDNAPAHRTRLTEQFLRGSAVKTLPWPANSPDLNPIEHVWSLLQTRINERNPPPATLNDLRTALMQEWANLGQAELRRLVHSMPRRCQAVIAATSPDLNLVEHVWSLLQTRINERNPPPATLNNLRTALTQEWANLGRPELRRLVHSMPRRCQAVIAASGGNTRY
jgi:transposase